MNDEVSKKNPYESPQASVNVDQLESYKPEIFTTKGRIGRLRYLAYSMIYNFIFMFMAGILGAILIPAISSSDPSGTNGVL